jgi:hypothetical protein
MSAHAIPTHRPKIEVWPRVGAPVTSAIVSSTARVRTMFALEYLAALSGDLSLSASPTVGTTIRAEIVLPNGRCKLEATRNHLDVTLVAETTSGAALLEALIADRLDGLAWGEDLQYQWSRAANGALPQHHEASQSVPYAVLQFLSERVLKNLNPSSVSPRLRDTAAVIAGLLSGLITGTSLGFLIWQLV